MIRRPLALIAVAILAPVSAHAAEASPARQSVPEGPAIATGADLREPTYGDRVFDSFVTRFFRGYFAAHPEEATDLGLHDANDPKLGSYDARLADLSRGALGREEVRLQAAYAELNSMKIGTLSQAHLIDRELLLSFITGKLLHLNEIRDWRRQPLFYDQTIAGSILQLAMRSFASPEERLRDVIAREKRIPIVLRSAMENLDNPPELWTKIAIENAKGTIDFLANDVPAAFAGVSDSWLRDHFTTSTDEAVSAYRDYVAWLQTDLLPRSHGNWQLGEATWRKLLAAEERVDLPVDTLLDIGFAELERQQKHFRETAAKIDPAANPVEVLQRLTRQHGKPETLISDTQALLSGLRDFLVQKQIVDLPSMDLPLVAETPRFDRAFIFASMYTPGAFEQSAHEAYFYETPPEPTWTPEHVEEHMQAYWQGDLVNTAIHEAYPGHYLQFLWLPVSPTYTRKVVSANTFVEGWAHYTEEMLLEEGYGDQDPKLWISEEQWALVRACRYLVSILMHTRGMSLEDAVAFFEKNAYLSPANAQREAERGTADPIYLYYTLGKLQIRALRKEAEAREGQSFSLRRFHDQLLSQGMMPIALLREALGFPAEAPNVILRDDR